MRLIEYIRVSTDEQAKKRSIGIQDSMMGKYADCYNHEIVDVIIDGGGETDEGEYKGISGSVPLEKRPGGIELLKQLRAGVADGFIIQRLDRGFRNTLDGLLSFAVFDSNSWQVHSVAEHIDTGNAQGKWALTLLLANAQLERDRISERATDVTHDLRERGLPYGPTPYGCVTQEGADNVKHLYRDIDTWSVRERIIEWAGQGLGVRAIATRLTEKKIPTPTGRQGWHASTVQGIINNHDSLNHIPFIDDVSDTVVSIATKATA